MAFTIRQLHYFVAVAEIGTVSGAAQAISISQSAITEAIKELEADLGVNLFERHSRGLNITHKGHLFLRHATTILNDVSSARMALEEEQTTERDTLAIGVTSLVAGYVLSDILSRFRRAYPYVDVNAVEDTGGYLEHLLIGGEIDVAVMLISNLKDHYALRAEVLESSKYQLWLPAGHALASVENFNLERLADERLIMLTIDEVEEATGNLLRSLETSPEIAFRTRSVEAVRSLVATGAGLALLPELIYRPWSLEGDRIEIRDISTEMPEVQVGIVWRRGSSLTGVAKNFIAIAQANTR